ATMDAVNAFNMELFSMIDMKPPISRAKMMSVTKSAIKAIKLYKHVVQIVEKFIKKCKPELKVPGLYVVDSIVRQSRHQFGVDKDVFGPRFLKNFTETFQNLYHCPEDDKSKIARVLNLWQKNGVFDMDILQPLMDMEDVVISPPPALEETGDFYLMCLQHSELYFRSPRRRRRSRSSSRSRWSRQQRSRSREQRWRSRSGSRDRSEREKDRERRQRGLPVLKSQTLSVCSTTLWVGQLDKKTQQSDVMSLLEEFGQIESINMIPPRGCAYIVMVHRQDAYTALRKLSRGSYKVNQKPVKIAWALNRGIKPAHKKFWDVEQGVTYIPWGKVKVDELETFKEGGILDLETLNPGKCMFLLHKLNLLQGCKFVFLLCFYVVVGLEWNIARDCNNQAAVNGPAEMVPDVTVAAHVQVMLMQSLNTLFLISNVLVY
uniref:SR-related CTD-associated factor 4b n=1 Tax=Nothobranchius furzeri TaxID=105023 RepID=A0A8C6M2K4_NOTFU